MEKVNVIDSVQNVACMVLSNGMYWPCVTY